jgi:protein transport protein HofB
MPSIPVDPRHHQHLARENHQILRQICQRYQAVLLAWDEQKVHVACQHDNPHLALLSEALKFASGCKITLEYWSKTQLEQAHEPADIPAQPALSDALTEQEESLDQDQHSPVIRFLNQVLRQAIARRASDIHFEPFAQQLRIRLRIDGILREIPGPEEAMSASLCARLKVIGQLNVAEHRQPQDGQLSVLLDGQRYSMRISVLPTLHGETLVLRILPLAEQSLIIEQLGLGKTDQQHYLSALNQPQGLILVTGPTGSGKTVTLYSGLSLCNTPERNICSVEDPIEIPLYGINQTQINSKIDLRFAQVLRAILRQDPDIIMIGEIRDRETAEIAVKAAQTGHLVLSTLHTNSTCETLTRLANMGIAGYQIAASLRLIIAQRLVRKLCPHCRTRCQSTLGNSAKQQTETIINWQAVGCQHCFSGYLGRIGIYELLLITPEIESALVNGSSQQQLAKLAQQQGMNTLFESGMALVREGITSLAELYRVTGNGETPWAEHNR